MGELEQIDALVAMFFAGFDNRDGRIPSHEALARFFAPNAVILTHTNAGCEQYTVGRFVEPRIQLLTGRELVDFHEWETAASTELTGSIGIRKSRYAKCGVLNSAPYAGQGSKFFQFGKFDSGWRISALAWADDA